MEEYNILKEEAINKIKDLLDNLEKTNHKKCKNLSKWLNNYAEYLVYEDEFKPQKLCRYRKGEVLKVNLGFNIGSEEGGVHYCIVLEKENSKNSPVVTVVPLTSIKDGKNLEKLKKGEVNLGNELFRLLNVKVQTVKLNIENNINNLEKGLNNENITKDSRYLKELDKAKEDENLIKKIENEIKLMKKGSIALLNQITTISKIKIIQPKNKKDVLSGIKFSNEKLDLIDEELRKMYIK